MYISLNNNILIIRLTYFQQCISLHLIGLSEASNMMPREYLQNNIRLTLSGRTIFAKKRLFDCVSLTTTSNEDFQPQKSVLLVFKWLMLIY